MAERGVQPQWALRLWFPPTKLEPWSPPMNCGPSWELELWFPSMSQSCGPSRELGFWSTPVNLELWFPPVSKNYGPLPWAEAMVPNGEPWVPHSSSGGLMVEQIGGWRSSQCWAEVLAFSEWLHFPQFLPLKTPVVHDSGFTSVLDL